MAELYVVFPLLVILRRRLGAAVLIVAVTLPVIIFGLSAPDGVPLEGYHRLAPNLAPVFALGVAGAGIVTAKERLKRVRPAEALWRSASRSSSVCRPPCWRHEHSQRCSSSRFNGIGPGGH